MREIKFRAWDKERKEMFIPLMLDWIPSGIPIKNPIQIWHQRSQVSDDGFWVEDFELMQFTGLKDKNGKEIFEGDIVTFEFTDSSNNNLIGKGVIVWTEYESGWCIEEIENTFFNIKFVKEVIGNIYENPELLGVRNR